MISLSPTALANIKPVLFDHKSQLNSNFHYQYFADSKLFVINFSPVVS